MKLSGGKMIAAGAVVGGALLATVMPVMADVAGESPSVGAVRAESSAKIKALGAAAEVQVTAACTAGSNAYINVNLTQAVLGGVANGSAYKSINCTGRFETYTFHVTATGKAFRWGTAYATAQLGGWPNSAHDEREIKLVP